MKKLAVIYDPHNLLQFIWYYSTYGKDKEWDALCLRNQSKGVYMDRYCVNSGIFRNVYSYDEGYQDKNIVDKGLLLFRMFLFALCGKRKKMCRNIVGQYINVDDYDEIVILTESGIVNGAFMVLGDEKNIVMLEDGAGDYVEKGNIQLIKHFFNGYTWAGFVLSKLGYACPGHRFHLKSSKYCDKYCSFPEKISKNEYKNVKKLFDYEQTDLQLYNDVLKKIYPNLNNIDFDRVDAVLFTSDLNLFTRNAQPLIAKTIKYISEKYKNVLIKKHPADLTKYDFPSGIDVQEVDESLPGEILLPYIKGKRVVIYCPTSLVIYMQGNENTIDYLYLKELIKSDGKVDYFSKEMAVNYLQSFNACFEMTDI